MSNNLHQNICLINTKVNLFTGLSTCNEQCTPVIKDISEYVKLSKEHNDFILAVINLKEYADFDNFITKAISSRRRKEYRNATNAGYYVKIISSKERNCRRDELFAINTSTTRRQGEMSEEYFEYPSEVQEFSCSHHFQKTYGVFTPDNVWIGYIYPRFCGEVVGSYRILGHAGYFGKINFMLLLLFNLIKDLYENHPNVHFFEYHLMYVGKQGLQDWKRNAGFKPTRYIGGYK
jgi:hypothetical protein